jgi:hypothetical protein
MGKPASVASPQWAPVPPMAEPRYIPVVWPKPKITVRGYVLAERPEGCYGHFVPSGRSGRTIGCVGRDNGCLYCGRYASLRWQGYVPILDGIQGRIVLAQVTKEAARLCPALNDPRRNLRGCTLILERLGTENNGRVQAEIIDCNPKPTLPRCPDVRAALQRLWGLLPVMYSIGDLVEANKIEEGKSHA